MQAFPALVVEVGLAVTYRGGVILQRELILPLHTDLLRSPPIEPFLVVHAAWSRLNLEIGIWSLPLTGTHFRVCLVFLVP